MVRPRRLRGAPRVLVVTDQTLFGEGVRRALERKARYLVDVAVSAHQAIHLADVQQPVLAMVDNDLRGVTAWYVASVLRQRRSKMTIMLFSDQIDDELIFAALRGGYPALLGKGIKVSELVATVEAVLRGEQPILEDMLSRPALARRIASDAHRLAAGASGYPLAPAIWLSPREVQVLDCVAQGLSNREIGEALFMSERTVKNHITSVLRKLNVEDRVQALVESMRHGWVDVRRTTSIDSGT